ncbi:MAG: peptidylprolyl isomerase [Paludibacteraceae bacterium]|nr:peptidylprolyl isomerase [Paludibacteraceae bacterium]
MRIILTYCILTLISTLVVAQNNMIDGIVWVVGDEVILRSEVEEQKLRMQYEGQKTQGDLYCVIPEQMAIQKLFLHQAKIDSVVVAESMVVSQVDARLNYFLSEIGSREKMEEYFKKTTAQIREELYEMMKQQMIVQQMQQKLTASVKLTPSEVRKEFDELPKDSIPTVPETVEIQIIKMDPPVSQEEIERIKNTLRDFATRVNEGKADFSMLARLYSDDKASASKGGELGFAGRGKFVPEFASAAFALQEPGKVSRVIHTEFGYHIIQLIEKRDERVNCRHILMKPKISLNDRIQISEKLDSIVTQIRYGNLSFEDAAMRFSSDKDTRMNGGLLPNPYTGASKFEYQNLPSEIAKKAYDLNVGEISDPFIMMDEKLGREVYCVVKVKSKVLSHKANINDDYQELKSYLEARRGNEVINEWIAKKIKETYIWIDDNWKNCNFQYDGWIKNNSK